MRPKEVGLIGFDQVTATHLTGPADALSAAVLEDGFGGRIQCYRVWTIGLTKEAFRAESGMAFYPDTSLAAAPSLDTIIIAGGSGLRRPEIREQLTEWILGRAYETRRIASICTGILALAPSGLLDGREVTTHWRLARSLTLRHPRLRIDHKRRLVQDGPFYTAAGLTAGVDLARALIEQDYGKQVALAVDRELMLYLSPKDVPNEHMPSRDDEFRPLDRFAELVAWVMKNLQQELTVDAMARQACMSPAHFTRAFKSVFGTTPGEFVENLRLNEARRRLASRRKTVRSVAESVGFANPEAFRRAFQRRFGDHPTSFLDPKSALSLSSHSSLRETAFSWPRSKFSPREKP
jgi:transcriptional regulator GlxA family with amidase domain